MSTIFSRVSSPSAFRPTACSPNPKSSRPYSGPNISSSAITLPETNSRERALRLEAKLKYHLPGLIVLEKTLYRQMDDPPRLSPEELEKFRRENEELNARPEVREALRQRLEKHYFEKWPRQKVPMLGNVTPLQAAKTEKGRRKLTDLLDYFDRIQDTDPAKRPKIDFDKLRRMLGLLPKAN